MSDQTGGKPCDGQPEKPNVHESSPPPGDPITPERLAKHDGSDEAYPTYVAIKGVVFDVSKNPTYKNGAYSVFTGKDSSRALACSSLKPEDCRPEWEDLSDKQKKTLDQWLDFFSKRYSVVGHVARGQA